MYKGLHDSYVDVRWGEYNRNVSDHKNVKVVIKNIERPEEKESAILIKSKKDARIKSIEMLKHILEGNNN